MEPFAVDIEGEFPVIGEALDTVKTARHQLGTVSHMSVDFEHSVADLHAFLEKVHSFLSDRKRVTLVAAGIIAAASLANYLRGWFSLHFRRG